MSVDGQPPVIAIDGPSGSGKGTIAGLLAARLGWHLLDSGALYRIVAAEALLRDIELDDAAGLAGMAGELAIRFEGDRVDVSGRDVSLRIREEDVSAASSRVAALAEVRGAILDLQRSMRTEPGLVADGRDMGTVVFPDAPLKIYLDVPTELVVYPGAHHGLRTYTHRKAKMAWDLAWFEKYLGVGWGQEAAE